MPTLSWRTDGAVTMLTLQRPEAYNAMSETMAGEFAEAVRLIAKEPS